MDFVYFSSDELPEKSGFTGYSFSKEKFIASKDISDFEVQDGNEGAYVSWIKCKDSVEFVTDWNGSGRWFLYKSNDDPSFWATSNSLLLLIEKLTENGKNISYDSEMVEYWGYLGGFTQQIQTNDTVVSEIKLISRWESIYAKKTFMGKYKARLRPRRMRKAKASTYSEALQNYLTETLSRFRFLLTSGTNLYFDLSGGLDSRVTFAFASRLIKENENFKDKIHVFSNGKAQHQVDFNIASEITSYMGVALEPRPSRDNGCYTHSPLRRWELNRLGQYALSTTIGVAEFDIGKIRISGGGGESYRDFWQKWGSSVQQLMKNRRHVFSQQSSARSSIAERICANIEPFKEHYPSGFDPLNILYREFRGRFHMAIPACEEILIFPLSGRLMDCLADMAPKEYFESKQVFFDIIHSLDPDLLDFPFDKVEKAPSENNIKALASTNIEPSQDSFSKIIKLGKRGEKANLISSRRKFAETIKGAIQASKADYEIETHLLQKNLEYFSKRGSLPNQPDIQPLQFMYLIERLKDPLGTIPSE